MDTTSIKRNDIDGGQLSRVHNKFCAWDSCITLLSWWDLFMGPAVDSRIKHLDAGILVIQIEYEGMATKHNLLGE